MFIARYVIVNWLLQYVRENNTRNAARMLNNSATGTASVTPSGDRTCLCHPLCTCSKCRPIVGAQERDMERSQVTVNSRDERGFTGKLNVVYDCSAITQCIDGLIVHTHTSHAHTHMRAHIHTLTHTQINKQNHRDHPPLS